MRGANRRTIGNFAKRRQIKLSLLTSIKLYLAFANDIIEQGDACCAARKNIAQKMKLLYSQRLKTDNAIFTGKAQITIFFLIERKTNSVIQKLPTDRSLRLIKLVGNLRHDG